jgi:deoxyribonuclease V
MADPSAIPHAWHLPPAEAMALQRHLATLVRTDPLTTPIDTMAGVDCAYTGIHVRGRGATGVLAAAVLCDATTLEVIDTAVVHHPCEFPYVPGLLSFREAPAAIAAVEALGQRPDLLMVDGQGIAHPRRLGIACHVALWLDIPTIGVAKSRLVGTHEEVGLERGSQAALMDHDETIGTVLRTRTRVKPLYISVGHRITLGDAVDWMLRAGRGRRLPEPTRLADKLSKDAKKGWM